MRGHRHNSYTRVSVGDTVMVYFEHMRDTQPREVEMLEGSRRYGLVNNGTTRQNPILRGRFLDTSVEEYFDNGFVQGVVRRSSAIHRKVNMYAKDPNVQYCVAVRRSIWEGTLGNLAVLALSKLPFEIDRPINHERLHELYNRQRAGIISKTCLYGSLVYEVKRDLFQRWIRKNYTQFCFTVKEITAEETQTEKVFEADYWQSVDTESEADERRHEDEEWEEMSGPLPWDLPLGDPGKDY